MALKYGFFNSANGDRKYNAEDIGRYLHGLITSGVYADAATSLQVLAGSGMTVEVQPGRAMLDYHFLENTEPLELTLAAGGTQARIDAIVMRLDMNERICEIAVKEGTPAASPKAPTMYRSDAKKEYMLASVHVAALTSSITQENISDTRANTTVCGYVTGIIDKAIIEESGKLMYKYATEAGFTGTEDEFKAVLAVLDAHATRHASGGVDPITPSMINAVNKSGDTMTGNLVAKRAGATSFKAINTSTNRDAFLEAGTGSFLYLTNQVSGDANNRVAMWLAPETTVLNNLLRLNVKINNASSVYNVLHSGNIETQGVAKIQVRTYNGTGKSGPENRNTLTFDFIPKIVIVGCTGYIPVVLINGLNQANQYSGWENGNVIWTVEWNDATVEWFMYGAGVYDDGNGAVETGADASGQMNESGKSYYAIAVG